MLKSCLNCEFGNVDNKSFCERWSICHDCSEWKLSAAAKRALNYVYGKPSMDVASWYPNLDGFRANVVIRDEMTEYLKNEVEANMGIFIAGGRSNGKTLYCLEEAAKKIGCRVVAESWFKSVNMPGIEKVIFNDPATIVIWDDGTKTVVKAQNGELFDPGKGLAMAVSKKALGNKGNYFDEFKKWLPEKNDCDHKCGECCPVETNDPSKVSENCKDCGVFKAKYEHVYVEE